MLALAVTAAGGLAVVAPLSGPADATSCASGVSASNVLGPATGWTEFVETDGSRSAESEGAIAYGGSFSTSGFTVGPFLPASTPNDQATAVIAGNHTGGNVNLARGSAYVGGSHGTFDFGGRSGSGFLASNPVDFAAAFSYLRNLSTSWGSATATGTITESGDAVNHYVNLTGTNASLNVFSLDQTLISAATAGLRIDVPANSTTIINVTGTSITFGPSTQKYYVKVGGSWQQVGNTPVESGYTGTVWNFPTATSVTIDGGGNFGPTVLAPNAHVTVGATGHTVGQMIAKKFTSQRETHLPLFQSTSCVPGTPSTPGESDVSIAKTASTLTPAGGSTFTYTLTATNLGDATATGVQIRDELPSGVTFVSATSPCTQSGGVVTCNVGSIAAHASTSVVITVTADPIAGAGPVLDPGGNHWMTPYHQEAQVDLEAGQQRTISLSCNAGDILSDGNFRVDHVDQGTGAFSDVKVLSSRINGTGLGTWKGVIRNDATGRVQAKAFIVCLPARTEGGANGHRHDLLADATPVEVTPAMLGVGRTDVTLTCRAGTVPIAPGYDLSAPSAVLVGSEGDYSHRTWTLTFDVAAPVTVTASVRCLSTTTSAVNGHTHELRFTHVVKTVSVPGNTPAEGISSTVTCPDDAKGVVGTFDLPPGVSTWGNDPQIKSRVFRLFNQSGSAKVATLDLFCLGDRVGTGMGTADPVSVVNTATVTSTSDDANAANNSADATVAVQPGSVTVTSSGFAAKSGGKLRIKVLSSMPGKAKVTVSKKAGKRAKVLGKGKAKLKAGGAKTITVKLTKAGKRKLKAGKTIRVKINPARGKTVVKKVRIARKRR